MNIASRTAIILAFLAISPCTAVIALPSGLSRQQSAFMQHVCLERRSLSLASTNTDSSFVVERLPLCHIFEKDSRKHLFTTRKNIRDYEWSVDEADQLFEDISTTDENNLLELGTINVMKASIDEETQKLIGKTSSLYDVHDGQQRLITLALLLAAIRDNLESRPDRKADAEEVAGRICPRSNRLKPVCRLSVRSKNAKVLSLILSKIDVKNNENLWVDEGETVEDLLGKNSPLMPKRDWKKLQRHEQCVLEVYENFLKRIKKLTVDETLDFVDQICYYVYIIVCYPSDTKIARSIVMGQSKGKDTEPVDIFKGMVCFSKIDNDAISDQILRDWNNLSDEVTREKLEETCILIAQGQQGKVLRRGGEIDMFESYLEDCIRNEGVDGRKFFEIKVQPAAKVLNELYEGKIRLEKNDKTAPSLKFILSATSVATAKEVKVVLMDLLLKHKMSLDKSIIEEKLKKLESVALWCMLAKPKPKERFDRCMSIIQGDEHDFSVLDLSRDEKDAVIDILRTSDFGSKSLEIKKAKAILERLNEYQLLVDHQNRIEPSVKSTLHLEHVLPQNPNPDWTNTWPDHKEVSKWHHRFGNLGLLNQRTNAKISNHPFNVKKKDFARSPYPLTKTLSTYDEWNIESLQKNHEYLIRIACDVFGLH